VADIVNREHPGWARAVEIPASDHIFSNWQTEAESLEHWPTGAFNPAFIDTMRGWIAAVMQGKE